MLKNHFHFKRVGIISLLFPLLLLPMLHLHPAYDHVHEEVAGHRHQAAVHADFFPKAVHGHPDHGGQVQPVKGVGFADDASHLSHDQVDLTSLHLREFFRFSGILKQQPVALNQDQLDLFQLRNIRTAASTGHAIPVLQTFHGSPPSLRAPPYFA